MTGTSALLPKGGAVSGFIDEDVVLAFKHAAPVPMEVAAAIPVQPAVAVSVPVVQPVAVPVPVVEVAAGK